MSRPSYLRPRGSPFLDRPPVDPGFTLPKIFQPDEALDPGFRRRPSPGLEGRHPGLFPSLDFTGEGQEPTKIAKPRRGSGSLKDRLLNATEAAAGTLDPNSDDAAESFFGAAISTFARGRGMSRQQQAQQDRALSQKTADDLRRAQAEYYRSRATQGPTGMTQANRLELEKVRHGHLLERIRTAADLRRRQVAAAQTGKVSPADRIVLGRTERADLAATRAVETHGQAVSRGYADPLTPGGEDSLRARIRRGVNPNYVADSTAVANRINPALGVPRAAPAAPAAPAGQGLDLPTGVMDMLRNYLRKQGGRSVPGGGQPVPGSSPGQSVQPNSAVGTDEEGDTADVFPPNEDEIGIDEGDDVVTGDEITAALDMVADLDDAEARNELALAGYSAAQIDKILAARPTP